MYGDSHKWTIAQDPKLPKQPVFFENQHLLALRCSEVATKEYRCQQGTKPSSQMHQSRCIKTKNIHLILIILCGKNASSEILKTTAMNMSYNKHILRMMSIYIYIILVIPTWFQKRQNNINNSQSLTISLPFYALFRFMFHPFGPAVARRYVSA